MDGSEARFALLVDVENFPATDLDVVLAEIARYGRVTVRRGYADWTSPHSAVWKAVMLDHSITPVQQFRMVKGKNASDIALVIDAMDLLHGGRVDGFCLLSSDSDFTRLAARLREDGVQVLGFGEEAKTSRSFVGACDRFVFVETLRTGGDRRAPVDAVRRSMAEAVVDCSDEDGWANLSPVGHTLIARRPDFDQRQYGFAKLSELFAFLGEFEVRRTDRGAVEVRANRPSGAMRSGSG